MALVHALALGWVTLLTLPPTTLFSGKSAVMIVAFLPSPASQAHTFFPSGPFFLLFPLPGMVFCQIGRFVTPSFHSGHCSCVTSSASSSLPHLCGITLCSRTRACLFSLPYVHTCRLRHDFQSPCPSYSSL